MTSHALIQPLEGLLVQIQDLIQLAKEGEWDQLDKDSVKYHQTAVFLNDEAYIEALIEADLVDTAKGMILQIQGLNDALDQEASIARDKMATELRQLAQAEKAMQAYGR